MSQVLFKPLTEEWVSFEELVGPSFSANVKYEIQNRGANADYLLALESDEFPTQEKNRWGRIIKPLDVYTYHKTGAETLYLRALPKNCEINVRSEEEMAEYTPNLIRKVITENGTYSASDDHADGYNEVVVDVPTAEVSGQISITTLGEVDVAQYETAVVQDANLVPENIRKDVPILGVMGNFEGSTTVCSHVITGTNNSSYDRSAGEKVWIKFIDNEYQIIDFADADADTFTGELLYDSAVGEHAEVRAVIDGAKTAHEFNLDFVDTGVPRPIINSDDGTVTFNDISQVVLKIAESIPTPTESVEIVVKMKSNGVGERDYDRSGCYFFEAAYGQYLLTPFIRVWCGNGVRVGYDGESFGKSNGEYDVVPAEDFKQDKWYWVKVTYTPHAMAIELSEDGAGWRDVFTLKFDESIDVFAQFPYYRNHFALQSFRTGDTVDGVYDLKETHVKIDGALVWQPLSPVEDSY